MLSDEFLNVELYHNGFLIFYFIMHYKLDNNEVKNSVIYLIFEMSDFTKIQIHGRAQNHE